MSELTATGIPARMKPRPQPPMPAGPRTDFGKAATFGALAAVLMLALLVGWATVTPISGAVIVSGQTVVRGKPKLVQSLDGGIVAGIDVAEGDRVRAGELLLRLDPTQILASLDIARVRLAENLARRARLESEQLGLDAPRFTYLALPFALPATATEEAGERRIFDARAELREGQRSQLAEQRSQIAARTEGFRRQIAAKQDELALIEQDLAVVSKLVKEGLARTSQQSDLARSRAALLGQMAELEAQAADLVTALRSAEIEALQQNRQFSEDVATELREVTAQIEGLVPQILTLETQLDRIDIRAPADGVVHEMAATTLGGVIAPGAVILQVVPIDNGLDFELRLDPRYVDQVRPGQSAQVLLAALDPRNTPKLVGTVASISPGTIADKMTGAAYYRVQIGVSAEELARLGAEVELVPGMPVEAFLETGERTVLRYLLKPLTAHVSHAFREG